MLAAYLVWHLRRAWAPLTFTDEHSAAAHNPVAPAARSPGADVKAATGHTLDGMPARSFSDLLDHLATLTRTPCRSAPAALPASNSWPLPPPSSDAPSDLLGVPIPAHLK
jgi:hypothetical protein